MTPTPAPDRVSGSGLAFGLGAYSLWGILPILFIALSESTAVEIVAWRVVLSLVFCVLLIAVTRGWARLASIIRDRSAFITLSIAGCLVLVNWTTYVFASVSGQVIEASLGYFTNPIVTVLLGVVVLRERLRPMQWIAIGVSCIAVLVIAIGYGAFPWIALTLAFSFGLYGLAKKRVGGRVDAIGGLTVETAVLTPIAIVALLIVGATSGVTFGSLGATHVVLVLSLGIATAVPLLFFAAAAKRLPLVYIGLLQFVAPIVQLLVGVFIAHEAMPPERWIGFGIVWVALAILTIDMFMHSSRGRMIAVGEAPGAP